MKEAEQAVADEIVFAVQDISQPQAVSSMTLADWMLIWQSEHALCKCCDRHSAQQHHGRRRQSDADYERRTQEKQDQQQSEQNYRCY